MQRVELKFARAQSHRQLFELKAQREDEERRGIFQKEPIILISSVEMQPKSNGCDICLGLEHHGPAACALRIRVKFDRGQELDLDVPQILSQDTKIRFHVGDSELRRLAEDLAGADVQSLSVKTEYRNLAGGGFVCEQNFSISAFLFLSTARHVDEDPIDFNATKTLFYQTDVKNR